MIVVNLSTDIITASRARILELEMRFAYMKKVIIPDSSTVFHLVFLI